MATFRCPVLHITGTADNSIVGTTQASQRRLPFDYTSRRRSISGHLYGADHMTYSGHIRDRPTAAPTLCSIG